MKRIVLMAALSFVAIPVVAQDASSYEKCSITPVAQVGFVDTFLEPADCEAACKETEGCDSWSFRPHSFDSTMPGQCKLIDGIFAEEASTSTYCGKM